MPPLDDHVTEAVSLKRVTGVCEIDIYAAVRDTGDHSILLERLLCRFCPDRRVLFSISTISVNRSLHVDSYVITSSSSPLLHGVADESVFGLLLFILYTTPVSHIISSSCSRTGGHVCAADT